MPNINSIATSGLTSYKLALETVANNIANVNTDGFSRQTVSFVTRTSENIGTAGFVGTGVAVKDVLRRTSDFNTRVMLDSFSEYNYHKSFYDRSVVIDSLFSREGTDISENLQNFFNALEQANETPDSIPARNVLFEQARFLSDQFQSLQIILDESSSNLDQQLVDVASAMTSISQNIADINRSMLSGSKAPDLLDERDRLVQELSEYTNVQTSINGDGTMNVNIGRGESLVVGISPSTVTAGKDPDSGASTISLSNSGVTHEITLNLLGGSLKAFLDYEESVLRDADRQLGLIAMAFAENFNTQNRLGMDFNNNIGQDYFTDFNSSALQLDRSTANPNNFAAPAADISVFITDINSLQNSDYSLNMTGALSATLTRESDNTVYNVTFAAPGAPPPTLEIATVNGLPATEIDGFQLNFTNAPAAGDRFNISPTRGMAGNLRLLQNDPLAIALASPVRAYANSDNISDSAISISSVTTTDQTAGNAPDLMDQFEIHILETNPTASPTSDFQYEIINITDGVTLAGGPFYGNYNTDIAVRDDLTDIGYNISIGGPVSVGDIFHTEFNTDGVADNSNGRLLADLQNRGLLNNGNETMLDRYSHMIADLGTETYYSNLRQESADILFRQAESQKLAEVGVNLDEEAANLVSLQQAYQAAGQLIKVNKEMTDIVFSLLT